MFQYAFVGIAAGGKSPLAASAASGGSISEGVANGSVTLTGTSSVNASGGVEPYTYSWTRTAGDTQITPSASTSATTGWGSSGTDQLRNATYKCTVTDAELTAVEVTGFSITAIHGSPP